jgi:5,10-methylenetetrahydromethanopterin reductase
VAAELGDGIFSIAIPQPDAPTFTPWRALLTFGTVFDEGEELTSPRVHNVLAPAAAVVFHATYERGGEAVDFLPGGAEWRKSIEGVPLAGTPQRIRDRLDELESAGVTEVAFQPGGHDLNRELRAFDSAAGLNEFEET